MPSTINIADSQPDTLVYSVQEIRKTMSQLGHSAKSQLNVLMLFYLGAKKTYGQPYFQYAHKDQRVEPHGVPVRDPRFRDPQFRRENTLRVLTRWQSLRAGLGFRARKLSEQQLFDRLERNKPEHSDSLVVRGAKYLRRREIQAVLANQTNIDRTRLQWMQAKQDRNLQRAQRSYSQILRYFLKVRPRAKELAQMRDACSSALGLLDELKESGITHIAIARNAPFRRLLVGESSLSYSALGALEKINHFLAHDAEKSALKLVTPSLTTVQPPPDAPNTTAATRPTPRKVTHAPTHRL